MLFVPDTVLVWAPDAVKTGLSAFYLEAAYAANRSHYFTPQPRVEAVPVFSVMAYLAEVAGG
ncbi:hypothetical protein ART_0424 [Arthrobacter sp. PAMC 25486]|uniref:hypothetical protein n=1 Tax=Arthrobacter sp. PAMC 25486 TaxID=1494608 RepID=UPI000535DE4F|nr:hypothetical protein [Arthrobacter sp. PAMC 25486]AIY00023.1 hypothetical protein ART_0424 [Arthrobacter sp. PAMC 25486]